MRFLSVFAALTALASLVVPAAALTLTPIQPLKEVPRDLFVSTIKLTLAPGGGGISTILVTVNDSCHGAGTVKPTLRVQVYKNQGGGKLVDLSQVVTMKNGQSVVTAFDVSTAGVLGLPSNAFVIATINSTNSVTELSSNNNTNTLNPGSLLTTINGHCG